MLDYSAARVEAQLLTGQTKAPTRYPWVINAMHAMCPNLQSNVDFLRGERSALAIVRCSCPQRNDLEVGATLAMNALVRRVYSNG
jgi:hypothetical protein